ncbi:hypothetical protein HYDPIDRAFT_120119 [Hydnomerulius pinastri MD-312]|uniref:Uncharacterized protein n=1 Tax=Hydnomerulius pinastri MD-312 TaxID=994086 RepID=A0A0C9VXG1_9AGAM|nr:hypothetical protein HYDPIDRAFT_120119 [Hydnomerulius pinastri MD-312]
MQQKVGWEIGPTNTHQSVSILFPLLQHALPPPKFSICSVSLVYKNYLAGSKTQHRLAHRYHIAKLPAVVVRNDVRLVANCVPVLPRCSSPSSVLPPQLHSPERSLASSYHKFMPNPSTNETVPFDSVSMLTQPRTGVCLLCRPRRGLDRFAGCVTPQSQCFSIVLATSQSYPDGPKPLAFVPGSGDAFVSCPLVLPSSQYSN